MSRWVTKINGKDKEEIESMEVCKWKINEVCCNGDSCHVADYPYLECTEGEHCRCYEKEDGVIKEE